ncbi:hypothetical protein KM043_005990 [Ampulex compressa]|nr:hypothetical protein KM043_005990 [Ampulex compressa]
MDGNQWLVFGQCRNGAFQSLADNNALGLVYKSAHCCQLKSSCDEREADRRGRGREPTQDLGVESTAGKVEEEDARWKVGRAKEKRSRVPGRLKSGSEKAVAELESRVKALRAL